MRIIVDGYNAPVTAGNFVDLVQRGFYDGMAIQRADGFVVQTGDPDGPVSRHRGSLLRYQCTETCHRTGRSVP